MDTATITRPTAPLVLAPDLLPLYDGCDEFPECCFTRTCKECAEPLDAWKEVDRWDPAICPPCTAQAIWEDGDPNAYDAYYDR